MLLRKDKNAVVSVKLILMPLSLMKGHCFICFHKGKYVCVLAIF